MACCDLQRAVTPVSERYYDRSTFFRAIEKYDIKCLVREAECRQILTHVEKNEVLQQRGRDSMRYELINLILQRGIEKQKQFAGFIVDFSRRAFEQTQGQLLVAGLQQVDVDYVKESSQLSQDSSSSTDSSSPMEWMTIEQMSQTHRPEDEGYFTNSSGNVSHDIVDQPDSFNLPHFQKTHHSLQDFITKKQQSRLAAHSSSSAPKQLSQPAPSTVNIAFNNYIFNNGSEKPGTHMLEYPGTAPRAHNLSRNISIDHESQQPQKWESKWRQCLINHHDRIISCLNVNELLPHLDKSGLVTPSESDILYSMRTTPIEQAKYLHRILLGKGEKGFRRFLECLRDEKHHLGHEDLVKCLGLDSQTPIDV